MTDRCEIGKCREECEVEGTLVDFVTGKELPDTVVEKIRPDIERFLVESRNYSKNDIEVGENFEIALDGEKIKFAADLIVRAGEKRVIVIKCTYDTLGSKERLVLSYVRLIDPYQIPFAVVANQEGAEVLDAISGKVIGEGLASIPNKDELDMDEIEFTALPEGRVEREKRILSTFQSIEKMPCGKI